MLVNYFRPREMSHTLNTKFGVAGGIRSNFFKKTKTHPLPSFMVEVKQGERRVAGFVQRKDEHQQITLRGYKVNEFEPPVIKLKGVISPYELLEDKGFGAAAGTIPNPVKVMAKKLSEYHTEFMDRIDRRIELMCIEAITKFQVTVKVNVGTKDVPKWHTDTVTFPHETDHLVALTGTNAWTDASVDKYATLEAMDKKIRKHGGKAGERQMVFGDGAWDLFRNDETLMKKLDNRRMELGSIKPKFRAPDGLRLETALHGLGYIYTYDEWVYDEEAGEDVEVWEDYRVVMVPKSGFGGIIHYGAIINLNLKVWKTKYYADFIKDKKGNAYETFVETAPLPIPTEVNNIVSYLVAE
jgi:hypothetical protein